MESKTLFACSRIFGEKAAEIPLVGTRFNYRQLGMCRILMNELEKVNSKSQVCVLECLLFSFV